MVLQLNEKQQESIADIESQTKIYVRELLSSNIELLASQHRALPSTLVYLSIHDASGEQLWSRTRSALQIHTDATHHSWEQQLPSGNYQIVAHIDSAQIDKVIYTQLQQQLIHMTGSAIGVMLFVWIIVNLLVVRPLREVVSAFDNESTDPLNKWRRDDEIGELIDAYNTMQQNTRNAERRVKIKQNHLEYVAYHDVLTNLPNRRAFQSHIEGLSGGTPSLIYIFGIDDLKLINDQHGSEIGDAIVAESGRRISALATGNEFCARLEGDEFGIVQQLHEVVDEQQLQQYGRRALEVLNAPHNYLQIEIPVTVSIGIARSGADQGDLDTAYKNATIALNAAKLAGRNRYCLFDHSMRSDIENRLSLMTAMAKAIDECEFFPVYQPKICLRRNQVIGAECLIRWRRTDGQIAMPGEFIPMAEETGLIVPISEQLLRLAILDAIEWKNRGLGNLTLALNLSAIQLRDLKLPDRIHRTLTEMNFPAERIELEITESAVMESTTKAIKAMAALKARGISLAIDDFGTGYSSLSYLKRFPVDTLKVDQSFVFDMCEDKDNEAIVNAVIGLSHHFRLNVVAEGIETQQQLDRLKEMGCDVAQGYHLGYPMPHEEFIEWCQTSMQSTG